MTNTVGSFTRSRGLPCFRVLLCERAVIEQLLRPGVLLDEIPAGLILQALNRANPGFAAATPLHHALQCFEHMEPVDIQAAVGDRDRMILLCAERSIDRGNPPRDGQRRSRRASGNRNSREISTIRFAWRKFQDKCLSLNTGTERPIWRNTSVILRNISNRGYSFCSLSLLG